MTVRNKEQSMGVTFNDAMIRTPEDIPLIAKDLAVSGFGIIRPFLRHTSYSYRSPEAINAVTILCRAAHKHGLRVVLDCEPHRKIAQDMEGLYPESTAVRLLRGTAPIVRGRFVVRLKVPGQGPSRCHFIGVESAWVQTGSGEMIPLQNLDYSLDGDGEIYQTGFSFKNHYYSEGRPAERRMHTHLQGELHGYGEGAKLIVYGRFSERNCVDFWSDGCRRYFNDLLECYRDAGLDGVGWDEPAAQGTWGNYFSGNGFERAFAQMNGYQLKDRLYLLDNGSMDADSVRVRLDYYRTLNEGLYQAQKNLIHKAREIMGSEILLGSHHTWQGEGGINDYRSGAVDYFRLNDNMDAGYTDCCWWDEKSVAYAYTLASSLGRLTPSGEAEVNTWHWKATNALVKYNARLITLYDINWFNIFYGQPSEVTRYPEHYTWAQTVTETIRNRQMQLRLNGLKPVSEIAVLHGWETVCGINDTGIAAAHKTFCLNLAQEWVTRSIAFDWIDTRLLESATIEGQYLTNALGKYRVLVLDHAAILPMRAWQMITAFANAGGYIIFTGAPPSLTTEGQSLTEDFAQMLEAAPLSLEEYLHAIRAVCTLPTNRVQQLEVCCPLNGSSERMIISAEGEAHGIRSPHGNVIYLSDLDASDSLSQIVCDWLATPVRCHSDSMLWRLYRSPDREALVLAAKQNRRLSGIVHFGGHTMEFIDGEFALLEFSADGLSIHGDSVQWHEYETAKSTH